MQFCVIRITPVAARRRGACVGGNIKRAIKRYDIRVFIQRSHAVGIGVGFTVHVNPYFLFGGFIELALSGLALAAKPHRVVKNSGLVKIFVFKISINAQQLPVDYRLHNASISSHFDQQQY